MAGCILSMMKWGPCPANSPTEENMTRKIILMILLLALLLLLTGCNTYVALWMPKDTATPSGVSLPSGAWETATVQPTGTEMTPVPTATATPPSATPTATPEPFIPSSPQSQEPTPRPDPTYAPGENAHGNG